MCDKSRFVQYQGVKWSGVLKGLPKSTNYLQPLFEALTNSLESIQIRQRDGGDQFSPEVVISLDFTKDLFDEIGELQTITITDNGVGFNSENYNRFITLKDDSKGFDNKGSGRIQLIHSFDGAIYDSTYKEGERIFNRKISMSASSRFLEHNSIVYINEHPTEVPTDTPLVTKLTLSNVLLDKDKRDLSQLTGKQLKDAILRHYILRFCAYGDLLPKITIIRKMGEKEMDTEHISYDDVPQPSHPEVHIEVPTSQMSDTGKRVIQGDNKVTFTITPFKVPEQELQANEISLTSRSELITTPKIKITCLKPYQVLAGCRFLFLVSSPYIDSLEGDDRGNVEILTKDEFKKRATAQGYITEQVTIEDIQTSVNEEAVKIYMEIKEQQIEFEKNVSRLKNTYLLSEDALANIAPNSSVKEILEKAYTYDARVLASENAQYDDLMEKLSCLNPASSEYTSEFDRLVKETTHSVPLQNRSVLTQYVVRRKLVLELMEKILNRSTIIQNEGRRNIDEKLLHNLIFKQGSESPLESELWVLSDEYLYFQGCSEKKLSQITFRGKKVFRDTFSLTEAEYLNSLGEQRMNMRIDVLLFPSEGKCLLIEFKNPNVNVSSHLDQINRYAGFMRNYTLPEFKFMQFYGYLVGEAISTLDVRFSDSSFVESPAQDFLFRPAKPVVGINGEKDGSLYTEVIKYSSLLSRAKLRNKAFVDLLFSQYVHTPLRSKGEGHLDIYKEL